MTSGSYSTRPLSFVNHVAKLTGVAFYHIRQLRSIRRSLTTDSCHSLVRALIISRLDYCNGLLGGAPAFLLARLSGVLRAAARLVLQLPRMGHISDAMKEQLHWLDIPARKKQAEFTRRKIEENKDNSKEQWKILNSILTSSNQENSCPLAAVAFQNFFTKKVEDIRSLTAGSTPPTALSRTLSKLEGFEEITSEEATIMLRSLPAKTSELDKVPTWLIKDSVTVFAPILAKLVDYWIRSFLTDRHQIFQVGPDRSPMVIVLYGLPQGTILGPQMYILYTADIESILERHGVKMHLYADDTQLYHHSRTNNLEQAMVKFEACLEDIVQWSSQRRLKLNPTKTELIWLDRAHAIERLPQQPRLRTSSNDLTSSSSVRVLGVIIDSRLTLVTHVSIVARNCFYQLRRIRQAKKNLDEGSVKTLIQALFLSRLDYCNSILANLPDITLAPLVRVQHSAARLIRNLKSGSSFATHDGAPLVTASLQNNIQVMRADAWRPLRYRAEIYEGVGHAYLIPARS